MVSKSLFSLWLLLPLFCRTAETFSTFMHVKSKHCSTSILYANNANGPYHADRTGNAEADRARRNFMVASAVSLKISLSFAGMANGATTNAEAESLIAELELTRQKLEPIPELLKAGEWDQVRVILKTPPVNFLWNMGDSKNPVLKLARVTDDVELIDLKDEISLSLQMCDQYTYDNVFVYFQPGNGKIKVKEPTELAMKAMAQIKDAIQMAKAAL